MEKQTIMICDYCENRDADTCAKCSHNSQKAGRELCIERMRETKGIKDSAKLRNIVKASEIVLFKDLCRVLGLPPALANRVTTTEAGKDSLENHDSPADFRGVISTFLTPEELNIFDSSDLYNSLDYCYECADMVYGSSIHASGTLLSEGRILLPIDAQTGDCHCNGYYAEELGHIKYDLLSLNTLSPIVDTKGINIDWNAAGDDRRVIEDMQDEDLTFIFQFGSPIVDKMIQGVSKDDLDVIALSEVTSINRPGPLNINLNETWVDRKNGNVLMKLEIDAFIKSITESGKLKLDIKVHTVGGGSKNGNESGNENAKYNQQLVQTLIDSLNESDEPDGHIVNSGDSYRGNSYNGDYDNNANSEYHKLRDLAVEKVISLVLEKKYGIPDKLLIFQEDIMALCSYGAGFTLAEADDIRRAMGKKKAELMESFKEKFIEGWTNIVGVFAVDVWDKMVDYAKYCFNKSHAVAYTLVTLKTAELQEYNFDEYMEWNYLNLKTELKQKAVQLLKEKGSTIHFPSYKKPFAGLEIGSISLNEIELGEGEELQTEWSSPSALFLSDLPVTYKLRFITRGLYDSWTKDILGLVTLNKKLGKKALTGDQFPEVISFKEFLDLLKMKGYIKYIETESEYRITTKVKVDSSKLTDEDFFTIAKHLMAIPKEARNYRAKCLIKEFGTYKTDTLTGLPTAQINKFMGFVDQYKIVFDKFRENNPGLPVRKYIDRLMKGPKTLYEAFDRSTKDFGTYICYVRSINVQKTGLAKVDLVFAGGEHKIFYTRDARIKSEVRKNDIEEFILEPNTYIGRDGYLKGIINLKLV